MRWIYELASYLELVKNSVDILVIIHDCYFQHFHLLAVTKKARFS